jgi:hypothetical protein
MPGMFRGPAVTRQYVADISRIKSEIEYPRARRAHGSSQVPAIIALTFTA